MVNIKHNLIGISGKISSGKDLAGKILNDLSGDIFENKKFADKLKEIVCLLIGCTREQLEDREFKEKELGEEWWYYKFDDIMLPISDRRLFIQTVNSIVFSPLDKAEVDTYIVKLTPRKLLQLLGTEAGRQIIHPDIWVNALMSGYKKVMRTNANKQPDLFNYPNWIITDVRFPNEIKAIKDRGGIVIRVNRPLERLGNSKLPKLKHTSVTKHPSETALDDYDFDHIIENNGSIEDLITKLTNIFQ